MHIFEKNMLKVLTPEIGWPWAIRASGVGSHNIQNNKSIKAENPQQSTWFLAWLEI